MSEPLSCIGVEHISNCHSFLAAYACLQDLTSFQPVIGAETIVHICVLRFTPR